jgi:hypothetical protein
MPKGSTVSALLEGKNNLLRMRQEIPMTDAEAAPEALECAESPKVIGLGS